ncbi:MAG: hypothetical protein IM638_17420 [Bacteroidetes bacterium]|nr:hypothetical protein [Bacteroidota bacterium]
MAKHLSRFITGKFIILALSFGAVTLVAEACGQKHACGSKSQKRKKNKRVKKSTNFMTY